MEREIKTEIKRILKKKEIPLIQVILFGSRARKSHTPESDWDLLIVLGKPVKIEERKEIWMEIYKHLHRKFAQSSFDIFIKTLSEFEAERRYVNTIAKEAIETGIIL